MSLNIEVFKPFEAKWVNVGEVLPGNETTSMRNFDFNGETEKIIFDCAEDNSSSTIFTFRRATQDLADLPDFVRDNLESMEARVLEKGESHIIELRKTIDGNTKFLRLTHT